ncbi:MAG: SIMPL domain-containing protein [Clostridia bacterium]|nr:SIMPL domain-containing protein [Clostridia bacterium]
MNNTRVIRVTGKGQIKIKPDMMRITMLLEGIFPEYSDTLRHSSEDTEGLRKLLSDFGFGKTDLKTVSFDIDAEYEGYEENGIYRQRFAGYRFRHTLKVEFDSDNDRLGRILYALAKCPAKPEFRISFTVKDREAAKNELLGKAVADAKDKAAALTVAANVRLGDIQSIIYSLGEPDLEVRPMSRSVRAEEGPVFAGMAKRECLDMDIEPDDIEASDTVTIVWEIE